MSLTCYISFPVDGQSFAVGSLVEILANAESSTGKEVLVQFFSNGISLGADTSVPFSIRWTSVVPGLYGLTAKATDSDGNTATSSTVNVNIT